MSFLSNLAVPSTNANKVSSEPFPTLVPLLATESLPFLEDPTTNTFYLENCTDFNLQKLENETDTLASELLLDDNICEKYQGKSMEFIASCEHVPVRFVELKIKNFKKLDILK